MSPLDVPVGIALIVLGLAGLVLAVAVRIEDRRRWRRVMREVDRLLDEGGIEPW